MIKAWTKPTILIGGITGCLIVIIGILFSLLDVPSNKTPSESTLSEPIRGVYPEERRAQGERGIAITPKSAREFLADSDIERWAVIVGISDYKNNPQIKDLTYADSDANAVYDFLVSPKGGAFNPDNICLLTNEKATVSNLRKAFGTFLSRPADKDLVLIFLSGHGSPDPKRLENLYFLTYDSDINSLPDTAYPMWEMETALLRFIKAKRVIVITDSCHSAAISGGMIAMKGNEHLQFNDYMKRLAESREGCTFITAARAGEGSQESAKFKHGIFTYFLLEGLKGQADLNKDGFITMKEAFNYLYSKVQRESENGQTPFASAYLDNSIPIGICEPEKLGIISKPKPSETKVNENKPDDAESYFKQGNTYVDSKDYKKAIECYKKAITFKPDYAESYYNLGVAYGQIGIYQKAIESCKEATRLKPDYAEAHLWLGYSYAQLGNYQNAIGAYKECVLFKPDYAEAHYFLGSAYESLGDNQKAIESFKEAIRLKPDYAEVHLSLDRVYLALAITYLNSGIAYVNSGNYQKAIELYKEAIRLKPDYAYAHWALGNAYTQLRDWKKAIEAYKEVIRINPNAPGVHPNDNEAHYNLGVAYGQLGDWKKAIESYKEAIRLKPDFAGAHYNLGHAYFSIGDRDSALEEYNILKGLDKDMANKLFNLIYGSNK